MSDGLLTDPVLQGALHAGAALLFLTAAFHKLRDPSDFQYSLAAYEIVPTAATAAAAAALVGSEIAVGVGCLLPAFAPVACAAGIALLTLYSAAIAVALARGHRLIDCGCGGAGGRRPLSGGLIARNAGLAGLLTLAALPAGERALVWVDGFTIASLLLLLIALHAALDVALANFARLRTDGASA